MKLFKKWFFLYKINKELRKYNAKVSIFSEEVNRITLQIKKGREVAYIYAKSYDCPEIFTSQITNQLKIKLLKEQFDTGVKV